jgi:hypothetical protein
MDQRPFSYQDNGAPDLKNNSDRTHDNNLCTQATRQKPRRKTAKSEDANFSHEGGVGYHHNPQNNYWRK